MSLIQKLKIGAIAGALALSSQANSDLVGHWKFEEGSGNTAYDSSAYGNNGTIYGATYVPGFNGLGLSFDGQDDSVLVPYSTSINPPSAITLEAYVKRNSSADGMIISKNGPYFLAIRDNKVEGGIYGPGTPSGWIHLRGVTDIGLDRWSHVMMNFDGAHIRVFLDHLLDNQAVKEGEMYITGQALRFGWGEPGHDQFFNGVIDEVKIHNAAVPEPSTLIGLGIGAAGVAALCGRRRK